MGMLGCYNISRKELEARSPFPLEIVPDLPALNNSAARRVVDLLRRNNDAGQETAVILPVGPLQYEFLADLCNQEMVSLERLVIFMMDEYLQEDGISPIASSHPLSFAGFMMKSFVSRLKPALRFSPERLIFPLPPELESVTAQILNRGGVDLAFAGVGISGHLAFNDPPEPEEEDKNLEWLRNTTARMVTLSRESCTQMALGGTHGNWPIIPRRAATLGMKEILASRRICLLGMRSWHAGTVRRAVFGPVSVDCPASLLQRHSNVELLLTELAARPPIVNVTLDTGEETDA